MTELVRIRKYVTQVEEIRDERASQQRSVFKGACMAVVENPFAGRYVEDLSAFSDALRPVGIDLGLRLIDQLGGDRSAIDGYGKGAIVGEEGELEHGAMWHLPGGGGMREALGKGEAIVPSTKKVGGVGARLDVPLTHLEWSYVGSHYDAIEVRVPDAPRRREIVLVVAMSVGGRVHARLPGGFSLEDKGREGTPS